MGFILLAALGAAADNVPISMTAVTATHEGRETTFFDKGLESVREALASLKDFDTYRKVKGATTATAPDKEVAIPLTAQYTFYCTPHATDEQGRILTSIRIEIAPKDKESKPVIVLDVSMRAVPGDPINIMGPKVDEARLVVVLVVGKK
jgi:hypothetical protein